MVLMATTKHYMYANLAMLEAVLNVALSLWWVRIWGLPGVIGGTLLARLLTTGWYIPMAAVKIVGSEFEGVYESSVGSFVCRGQFDCSVGRAYRPSSCRFWRCVYELHICFVGSFCGSIRSGWLKQAREGAGDVHIADLCHCPERKAVNPGSGVVVR